MEIAKQFNDIEKEILFLKAVVELIDSMVNFEILQIADVDPDSEIRFNSLTHQQFFNIMLVDFLSPADNKIIVGSTTYLDALKDICVSPHFDKNDSIIQLNQATREFTNWLNKEILFEKIWLPLIDLEVSLKIKRMEFIEICGNISKHNFTRLGSVVKKLKLIFERNNQYLSEEEALLILSDFYEWFHEHIFSYHSSAIAEFLHNIRWGIYEYLQPEFYSSITYGENDSSFYQYTYPTSVVNRFAKSCYWDLMNKVRSRSQTNMPKFQVTQYLKMDY